MSGVNSRGFKAHISMTEVLITMFIHVFVIENKSAGGSERFGWVPLSYGSKPTGLGPLEELGWAPEREVSG